MAQAEEHFSSDRLCDAIVQVLDHVEPMVSAVEVEELISQAKAAPLTPSEARLARKLTDFRVNLEHLQMRETELSYLLESVFDLQRGRETDVVLGSVVRRARKMVRADFGSFTHLPERGPSPARFYEGAFNSDFTTQATMRGRGILGHVVATRAPFFTSSYFDDTRFQHDPDLDAALAREGILSMVGVPLIIAGEVQGVFFMGNRYSRTFLPHEIALLTALASHAALALENANLLEEVRGANAELALQRSEILDSASAHEQMTDLVARGGGLEDLVQLATTVLGRHIVVLDEKGHITHYSDSSISDELHATGRDHDLRRLLVQSRDEGNSVLALDKGNFRVAAVTGGGELLGGLAISPAEDLSPAKTRSFEHVAMVMGIVMLAQERAIQRAHLKLTELFTVLFRQHGTDILELRKDLKRLGIDFSIPICVMVVALTGARPAYGLRQLRPLLPSRACIAGEHEGRIVILLPEAEAAGAADKLQHALDADEAFANIAYSPAIAKASGLPDAYALCVKSLKLAALLGERASSHSTARLGVYALLFDGQRSEELQQFVKNTIGPLIARTRATGTDLANTLLVYLDNSCNVRRTADQLGIHDNTLRQRLESIDGILGEWRGRSFEIQAALRLWSLKKRMDPT